MKKALKIVGILFLLVAIIFVSAYFYVFREQEIAVRFIPNEFEYCGSKIWGNDEEYKKIVSWLKQNKDGWVLSYVTFVPNMVYRHPAFVVNVIEGGVVVSYKTDYGYPQYVKTIEHGLSTKCARNS
jgi:hypothetical protein